MNILWGLINLLPIYPLDGGRVARELFTLEQSAPRHRSIAVAVDRSRPARWPLYGLTRSSIFTAFMFGYLAYASYQTLQAYEQHWQ